MNLEDFKSTIQEKATDIGIASFVFDWVHVINDDPQNEYDLLLMVPPKDRTPRTEKEYSRTYDCMFYLFVKNEKQGRDMTSDEKATAWSGLQERTDELMEALFEKPSEMIEVGNTQLDFDDGHIGADDLIFVKITTRIKAQKQC